MPAKGPIPKRSTQRLGHRTVTELEQSRTITVPKVDKLYGPLLGIPDAHPLAANWYGGLRRSGQAEFYEPSDWAQAQVWTELLSKALDEPRPSAVMIAAWSGGAAELLTTEGARRRMRMELERIKPPDADQTRAKGTVAALRSRLTGG